jgi:hypothetical protein
MAKKSYFAKSKKTHTTTAETQNPPKKGDLNGDGKVDWVDSMLAIVGFIQTPKGQMFIVLAAATFSAAINMSSYTKTTAWLLAYLRAGWLMPFAWIVAFTIWAVIQVFEVLPRTGFWDFDTKVQIVKSLQGAGVPIKDYDPESGQQTDMVYWQDITINDAKMRRGLFLAVSLMAHAADVGMLWGDYPFFDTKTFALIIQNVLVVAFLIFSFEGLVGIAQSLKQLQKGYSI